MKETRLALFADNGNYMHVRMDLADREGVAKLFEQEWKTDKKSKNISERWNRILKNKIVIYRLIMKSDSHNFRESASLDVIKILKSQTIFEGRCVFKNSSLKVQLNAWKNRINGFLKNN